MIMQAEELVLSTAAREWPNVAKEARDQAAERTARSIRALQTVIEGWNELSEMEKLKRIAVALNHEQVAIRLLEKVGAQTTPLE